MQAGGHERLVRKAKDERAKQLLKEISTEEFKDSEYWSPIKAASFTGSSFAVVSLVPILPFAFMKVTPAVITAGAASIAFLFGVGSSKAIFTWMSWVRSGLEMMGIGILASVATYGIGLAIPV